MAPLTGSLARTAIHSSHSAFRFPPSPSLEVGLGSSLRAQTEHFVLIRASFLTPPSTFTSTPARQHASHLSSLTVSLRVVSFLVSAVPRWSPSSHYFLLSPQGPSTPAPFPPSPLLLPGRHWSDVFRHILFAGRPTILQSIFRLRQARVPRSQHLPSLEVRRQATGSTFQLTDAFRSYCGRGAFRQDTVRLSHRALFLLGHPIFRRNNFPAHLTV